MNNETLRDSTVILDDADDKTVSVYEDDQTLKLTTDVFVDNGKVPLLNNPTYKIIEQIGQGGGGIVYKAVHTRLKKEVVIKQIKGVSGFAIDKRKEVDLLKGLKHTCLPQVLDFIEENGETYTVMDFVSGADFDKIVASKKRLKAKEVIRYAIRLCEAVDYLHKQNPPIIHSDIKPANVMLTQNNDICLIDFNVSLALEKNKSTVVGGTPGYAPPEQFGIPLSLISHEKTERNAGIRAEINLRNMKADERSDVFSIGATLYYMISGKRPARDYNNAPLTQLDIHAPEGLVYIISKAMELNPAKRYKNAGDMLKALKNISRLDRRYRIIKVQREIVTILCICMLVGFARLSKCGADRLAEEREEKYSEYISRIEECIDRNNYSGAAEAVSAAIDFIPERIFPYYYQTKILSETKKYDECIAYVNSLTDTVILELGSSEEGVVSKIYAMAASCAFEKSEYSTAVDFYSRSIMYDSSNIECYRDLCISYARSGNAQKAEEVLEKAKENGVSGDQLELVAGEICYAKKDFENAYISFKKAIRDTDNDYIKFRAILICDKMLTENKEYVEYAQNRMISMIYAELDSISLEYRDALIEMIANQYVIYGKTTNDSEQYKNAAVYYEMLMSAGKLNYTLEKNYFNICYELRDYAKCTEILEAMGGTQADDYWVLMNYSYVAIMLENQKNDPDERDYTLAYEFYLKADELYKKVIQTGKSDPLMDSLEKTISDIKSKNLL